MLRNNSPADQLLAGLIETEAPPLAVAPAAVVEPRTTTTRTERTAEPRATPQRKERTRRMPTSGPLRMDGLYDRVVATFALTFVLLLSAGLWWVGAFFSLQALAGWGVRLAQLNGAQWLIPAAVTAAELSLWPIGRRVRPMFAVWALIVAFDIGTTVAGLLAVLAGRHLPLFAGYTIPSGGAVLMGISLMVGLVCAFGPERLGRASTKALVELWQHKG